MAAKGEVEKGAQRKRDKKRERQKSAELITRPVRRTHATRPSRLLLLLLLLLSLLLPLSLSLFRTVRPSFCHLFATERMRGREERNRETAEKIESADRRTDGWTGDGRMCLRDFVGTGVKANWSINYPGDCVYMCVHESRFALALARDEQRLRLEVFKGLRTLPRQLPSFSTGRSFLAGRSA